MNVIQEVGQNAAAPAGAAATGARVETDSEWFARELDARLEAVASGRDMIAAAMERLASAFPGTTVTNNRISGFGEAREHYLKTGDAASINVGADVASRMAGDDDLFERVKNSISTLLNAGRQQNLVNAGGRNIHRNVNIQEEEIRYVEVQRTAAGVQLSVASFSMATTSAASGPPETPPGDRDSQAGFRGLVANASSWRLQGTLTVRGLSAASGQDAVWRQTNPMARRSVSLDAIIRQWQSSSTPAEASGSDLLAYIQLAELADPLVLDLGGGGIRLTSAEDGVYFDIKGDGSPVRTAFIQGDNALLYLDRNGNNTADDATELFGDRGGHADGYEALAQYDDDGNGTIDADDSVFGRLRLWRDLNRDGVNQENESMTLAEAGIVSLGLNRDDHRELDAHGNVIAGRSSFTRSDGSAGLMAEAWFRTTDNKA